MFVPASTQTYCFSPRCHHDKVNLQFSLPDFVWLIDHIFRIGTFWIDGDGDSYMVQKASAGHRHPPPKSPEIPKCPHACAEKRPGRVRNSSPVLLPSSPLPSPSHSSSASSKSTATRRFLVHHGRDAACCHLRDGPVVLTPICFRRPCNVIVLLH